MEDEQSGFNCRQWFTTYDSNGRGEAGSYFFGLKVKRALNRFPIRKSGVLSAVVYSFNDEDVDEPFVMSKQIETFKRDEVTEIYYPFAFTPAEKIGSDKKALADFFTKPRNRLPTKKYFIGYVCDNFKGVDLSLLKRLMSVENKTQQGNNNNINNKSVTTSASMPDELFPCVFPLQLDVLGCCPINETALMVMTSYAQQQELMFDSDDDEESEDDDDDDDDDEDEDEDDESYHDSHRNDDDDDEDDDEYEDEYYNEDGTEKLWLDPQTGECFSLPGPGRYRVQ